MKLEVGMKAPDFTLKDQNEEAHTLSSYQGKPVVLFFYPKDDTPGCTIEVCGFRDDYSQYENFGAVLLGVSVDNTQSHAKFINKFNLPFSLLADTEKEVVNKYGVWGAKKSFGKEYEGIHRVTLIIDRKGEIANIFPKVKPDEHSQEVLAALENL